MNVSLAISRRRFRNLARSHNVVPVVAEVLGDLQTPVSAFLNLRSGAELSFLLESVEGGNTWGRYSVLGTNPAGRFTATGNRVTLDWRGRRRELERDDPLTELRRWLRRFRPAPVPGLPRFFGGAVGYVSYDAIRYFERIPDRHRSDRREPEIDLLLVDDLVVFDNLSHTLKIVVCAHVGRDADRAWDDALQRIDTIWASLSRTVSPPTTQGSKSIRWVSDTKARGFGQSVARARDYILAGDAFQIVLSHELSCRLDSDPVDVYRALRCINPSPYMFYLGLGERTVVGASPEVLVRVEDGRASVRPIAGTRRRGRDETEDRQQVDDLLADEKERAEHVMLVDLGRNDLGRICEYATVRTEQFMSVELYSHVIHLVSHVQGKMAAGRDCFDALRACFPAGTVSGAPKIRAMEIIDELELRRRGVYAGAVGYFGFDGAMDTCIAIRTVVCENGRARVGVGAGIVLDSRPRREWNETMEKADAAKSAVELAARGLELR